MEATHATSALGHLRVLDLSESIAGQYCARMLADFGAEVMLIEPPGGSAIRRMGPFRASGESHLFLHLNLGKQNAMIDHTTPDGWARLLAMAKDADAIIVPAGVDRDALAKANPQAVICLCSDFGVDGPRAHWRGGEMIHQALSGVMYKNGHADREPLYGCGHRASYAAGVAAYTSILAAIFARARIGRGQQVSIDTCETASAMTYAVPTQYNYNGTIDRRSTLTKLPSAVVKCRDAWLTVFIYAYRWRDTWNALGMPGMADDPRFTSLEDRMARWDEVAAILAAAVADKAADDVVNAMQAVGAIASKAATPAQVAASSHLAARDYWQNVTGANGVRRILGPPFRMSATPWQVRGEAPPLSDASKDGER